MKAAVYEGKGKIEVKEVEKPALEQGGMIAKIEACAICGTDLKAYLHGNPRMKPPLIPGHEFSAKIVEIAQGIENFQIGQRITLATSLPCGACAYCLKGRQNLCENLLPVGTVLDGAFAEYLSVPARAINQGNVLLIPEKLSPDAACLSEPLGCVINGQEIVEVGLGDRVAIIGAGPIGLLHIEVARAGGASKVFLIQRSKKRLALAEKLNPDALICSEEKDPVKEIMKLTRDKGVEVVIVAAPSGEAQVQGLEMVAKGGRISLFSSVPKDNPFITINSNLIHYKEIKVCGSSDSRAQHQKLALEMLGAGKVNAEVIITHQFPLANFMEALKIMQEKEGLKIIIHP